MEKVICIVGPTGIGKSKVSIELAKLIDGEIISGDAYQVYQELSIGTAKIAEEEQQGIVHHLVNCKSINEDFSVKTFQQEARKLIKDINAKGKTAIVCGGTGLYIKALLYDYEFKDEQKDYSFLKQYDNTSNEELYQKLQEIDYQASINIHPNNRQRVLRALEIAHNGDKKSDIIQRQNHEMLYDAEVFGLTMDREYLYEKINERVDKMFDLGLVDEVQDVIDNVEDFDKQALKAIGYKEFKEYYLGNSDLEAVKEQIKLDTRRFAKRQYTWFRNQMDVQWIDIENEEPVQAIINYLEKHKKI